jgi:GDP-mannose 6-dehydrogenase
MADQATLSIFGLGYVGSVCSACFASRGHKVIGVDPNPTKVRNINDGASPIIEDQLGELIKQAVTEGRLTAMSDEQDAVNQSDISLISVGTPSCANGSLDLLYVRKVSEQIGEALRNKDSYHVVVLRSTVLPGTTENVVIPIIEQASGKKAGVNFGIAFNPEFLREASAVKDFKAPPKTVIGALNEKDADIVANLYEGIEGPLFKTDIRTAETVKYADNAFHALKVVFGNEVGALAKSCGVDSHKVMDIFCADTKLNLSPYYLKPGFAFGGSCLPKDLRALVYLAKTNDIEIPMLGSLLPSNETHIKRALRRIIELDKRTIGILGFAFKNGTDDLRESPIVELVESLIGKGYRLKLYDENVSMARLVGANKEFIENRLPHISELMVTDTQELVDSCEVIIVGNKNPEFVNVLNNLRPEQHVLDLVRIAHDVETQATYEGICW